MRFTSITAATVLFTAAVAFAAPPRPKITGVSHLAIYASDPAATGVYFTHVIGAEKVADPENPHGARYMINPTQFVEVLPLPAGEGVNRLSHVGYKTDNAEAMRAYLAAKGYKTPTKVLRGSDGSKWFAVHDPEGNEVEFVQTPAHPAAVHAPKLVGHHIIHVGYMVHDRAKEDTFYRALLDFRPYWYGGMKDDHVDWVSEQTPESHDWIEYMMTGKPTDVGITPDITQSHLGVIDHVAIGVPSVETVFQTLKSEDRLTGKHDDAPKMGRDGKMQLNLYSPELTRIEMMNFSPTEKPCCSPFTAPNPSPSE
ncbi:MAG: VOC family protein [Acidobacteriota bacterium]|nr:VOC family protein [Acidobacteriota bacterium]